MDKAEETSVGDGFGGLGLDANLVKTLAELGYEEPTPIQREAIPALLTGKDVIGQAATGTGKTAAFALPILQRLAEAGKERAQPSALVLVPTRELAMQVAEAMHKYGQKLKLTTISVYGGHSFSLQQRMLERGVDVVVATPGRALDHIKRKTMDLSGIMVLALDEADEMLDMGFADDLEAILSETPAEKQTVFFSATLPARISGMVKRHMKDPIRIQIAKEPLAKGTAPKVKQIAYIIPRQRKLEVLGRVLDLQSAASTLVFCRTRTEVDNLTERLSAHGYRAMALHGGITQDQRTRVVKRLREGAIDMVVATDVAARGLDIENLELVVNYDVPVSPDSYVHRIGRVGRAGREGVAISLADPRESRLLNLFERQTKSKITIAQVPTVADLRAKRLESFQQSLREIIAAGGLDKYRGAVEALAQEHDLMEVALAAVRLAYRATGGERDEEEEQDDDREQGNFNRSDARNDRGDRSDRSERGDRSERNDRAPREDRPERPNRDDRPQRSERPERSPRPVRQDKPARVERAKPPAPTIVETPKEKRDRVTRTKSAPGKARIYVGIGKTGEIRPQELVEAIVSNSDVESKHVGSIDIFEKYTLVELPAELVDQVIDKLGKATLKNRKVTVRRFEEQ